MKVMVLVDGSEHADRAFNKALTMLKEEDELLIVNSCEYPEIMVTAVSPMGGMPVVDPRYFDEHKKALQERAARICEKYVELCKEKGVKNFHSFVLTTDSPKEGALEFAKDKEVETIFVGTRGLGAIKSFFLGSFSSYIVNHASCDVVLVKGH